MCEYCDEFNYDRPLLAEGEYCTAGLAKEKDGTWSLFCTGDDAAGIEINYCPICNRPLSRKAIERQRQQQIERLSTKAREFKYRAQARRLYADFTHGTITPEKEEQNLAESKRCLKISEAYEKRAEKLKGKL